MARNIPNLTKTHFSYDVYICKSKHMSFYMTLPHRRRVVAIPTEDRISEPSQGEFEGPFRSSYSLGCEGLGLLPVAVVGDADPERNNSDCLQNCCPCRCRKKIILGRLTLSVYCSQTAHRCGKAPCRKVLYRKDAYPAPHVGRNPLLWINPRMWINRRMGINPIWG